MAYQYGGVIRGGDDIKFMDELRNEPILLSHHPLCGRFSDHLLTIRGRKVCRGCITVYPTFAVMLVILLMVRPEFMVAFVGSLFLFCVQLSRFITTGRRRSTFFNTVLGSSLAPSSARSAAFAFETADLIDKPSDLSKVPGPFPFFQDPVQFFHPELPDVPRADTVPGGSGQIHGILGRGAELDHRQNA